MQKKFTTYTAVAPDGSKIIRHSQRTYTHAVLVTDSVDHIQQRRDAAETSRYLTPEQRAEWDDLIARAGQWGAIGFCGRLDLAEKLYNRSRPHSCWDQMIIVEVDAS